MKLVHQMRENRYRGHITLGGYWPTFHSLELMHGFPAVDSVVRHEGENTLLELAEHLPDDDLSSVLGLSYRAGAVVHENPQRPLVRCLDELPFPARDFTAHILSQGSYINVSTSRGCYANCSFCAIARFFRTGTGKVWRRRSAESLAEEVEALSRRFRFNCFKFIDDQFILSNKEGNEFCENLSQELGRRNLKIRFQIACRANNIERALFQRLKDLGLEKVFIGVESGHQRGLDTFHKQVTVETNNQALATLRELDILYDIGFILVDPYTTHEELKQNLKYMLHQKSLLQRRGSYLSVMTSLIAYGGTPIYDRLIEERRLLGDYVNGFTYQVADKNVRRFQFLMKFVFGGVVLPIIRRMLFLKNDLRSLLHQWFHRDKWPPQFSTKGGESGESSHLDGLRDSYAADLERHAQHAEDRDLGHDATRPIAGGRAFFQR